jgi:hypothetical protein
MTNTTGKIDNKKRDIKIRRVILMSIAVAMLLPAAWISGTFIYMHFFFNLCDLTVHKIVPSPYGKYSMVIHSIDCGAATRFNSRASLALLGREFIPERSLQFLHLRGLYNIDVKWFDEHTIEISTPGNPEAFNEPNIVWRENTLNGFSFVYK